MKDQKEGNKIEAGEYADKSPVIPVNRLREKNGCDKTGNPGPQQINRDMSIT